MESSSLTIVASIKDEDKFAALDAMLMEAGFHEILDKRSEEYGKRK